jgi:hypothetical protein
MNVNRFFILVSVSVMLVSGVAVALDDIPIPSDFYDGAARKAQVDAIDVRLTAAEGKIGANFAQADTNATTTATAYTPEFVGQVLVGSQGSGTNAVWVAKGTTTNDWVIVEP